MPIMMGWSLPTTSRFQGHFSQAAGERKGRAKTEKERGREKREVHKSRTRWQITTLSRAEKIIDRLFPVCA